MSNFYYGPPHHPAHLNAHSHNHHGGRSRRAPRIAAAHNPHKFRPARSPKEVVEPPHIIAFRRELENAISFELEDDEIFCPFNCLTDDDLQTIHSSGSDRSSLSSGSPDSSPQQHQIQPTPTFVFSTSASSAAAYSGYQQNVQTKLHQPLARTRNAIPIVDPTTRAVASPASPPASVSPARQMQQYGMNRRW